ncbi:hypothetical protein MWU52_09355 [Jannaschia sp. S6380]|uniref:hypothetical protein n=1 Tax=Jannaschia sp. S6380 TaxID=2926408 RepID=UPI001FF10EB2|nr:hypothetical protein [Jannaschia sp. S6380]MCK0167751.1 hypothetical protein [Jannaschia sp. S6380]
MVLMVMVWLSVYPIVTIMTYLTVDSGLTIWLRTFVTTIPAVPLSTYIVVPNAKRIIATHFDQR